MTDGAVLSNVPGRPVYLEDGTEVTRVPVGEESLKAWMLPGSYIYMYDVYGKELNTFAKLTTNFAGKTGPIHHRLILEIQVIWVKERYLIRKILLTGIYLMTLHLNVTERLRIFLL